MPWSYPDNVPAVARNWTDEEQERCVEAANAALEETGSDEQAIYACIAAAGKGRMMEKKTYRGAVQFKESPQGAFEAEFAALNVIDHDGDVTLPGAFSNGEAVRVSHWGHGWNELPVGKGAIREQDGKAIVDGQFFLDTATGKEHYLTVKNLGDLQEWSYGYDVVEASTGEFDGQKVRFLKKLKVHEVSPVMLGAGIGTRTTTIKAAKQPDDEQAEAEGEVAVADKPSGKAGRVVVETTLQMIEYT